MSGDAPATPPAGDANIAPQIGGVAPGNFLQYIGSGGGIMAASFNLGSPVLPNMGITGDLSGARGGVKAKAGEVVPGAGLAMNPFDTPAMAGSGAAAAMGLKGASELPTGTSSDTSTRSGITADASDKPSMAKLTFDAKNSKDAHVIVNEKGEVSLNKDNMPRSGSTELKGYIDPKFAGAKDPAQMERIINEANAKLKSENIKVEIQKSQADIAKAVQTAQDAQKARAKSDTPPMPKAQPPGGGPGGGGGGGAPEGKKGVPDAPPHTPRDHTINKKTTGGDLQKMSAQVSETHKAADGSEYKGMHPQSYKDFTEAVYSRIPAYSQAGGISDQLSAIDDDPHLTPEEKAAKKAALMAKFQKEHETDIKNALNDFRNESKTAGLNDTEGFDSIAKSLADPSKANDIAGLLSKKPIPGETLGQMSDRVAKVYDVQAQIAMQNVALVESKDSKGNTIDWKPSTKDKAALEAIKKDHSAATAAVEYRPFSFKRK